jgi:AcrR family transcriptional regulator
MCAIRGYRGQASGRSRAAGTSDRMLIYHFGTKARLMEALLDRLAQEMLGALAAALPARRADSEAALAAEILALLRTPTFRPYLRVWFDILSATGRGDGEHGAAAIRILTGQLDWIEARLPENTPHPRAHAKAMLATIQGALVLDLTGMHKAADLGLSRAYPNG